MNQAPPPPRGYGWIAGPASQPPPPPRQPPPPPPALAAPSLANGVSNPPMMTIMSQPNFGTLVVAGSYNPTSRFHQQQAQYLGVPSTLPQGSIYGWTSQPPQHYQQQLQQYQQQHQQQQQQQQYQPQLYFPRQIQVLQTSTGNNPHLVVAQNSIPLSLPPSSPSAVSSANPRMDPRARSSASRPRLPPPPPPPRRRRRPPPPQPPSSSSTSRSHCRPSKLRLDRSRSSSPTVVKHSSSFSSRKSSPPKQQQQQQQRQQQQPLQSPVRTYDRTTSPVYLPTSPVYLPTSPLSAASPAYLPTSPLSTSSPVSPPKSTLQLPMPSLDNIMVPRQEQEQPQQKQIPIKDQQAMTLPSIDAVASNITVPMAISDAAVGLTDNNQESNSPTASIALRPQPPPHDREPKRPRLPLLKNLPQLKNSPPTATINGRDEVEISHSTVNRIKEVTRAEVLARRQARGKRKRANSRKLRRQKLRALAAATVSGVVLPTGHDVNDNNESDDDDDDCNHSMTKKDVPTVEQPQEQQPIQVCESSSATTSHHAVERDDRNQEEVSQSLVTTTETSKPSIETIRAKLERAKAKKMQLQERLQLEKAASQVSSEDSSNIIHHQNRKKSLVGTSSKAEQAKAKLEAARSKLRGALKNRERVLRRSTSMDSNANSVKILPPISALSSCLVIRNIPSSGSKDKVYFPPSSSSSSSNGDSDRARLEKFLGKDVIQDLHTHKTLPLSGAPSSSTSIDGPASLAARKLKLQQELIALKRKLEKSQTKSGMLIGDKSDDDIIEYGDGGEEETTKVSLDGSTKSNNEVVPSSNRTVGLTKQELERRKAEAQATMDISYWKHFVSKQERMLENVMKHGEENDSALEECQKERHETNKNLLQTQKQIEEIECRIRIVENGISASMTCLLHARQAIYDAKKKEKHEEL